MEQLQVRSVLSGCSTAFNTIEQKKADGYCRKVGIMVGRDKLMSSWDEGSYETHNFYDALLMLIELALHESIGGWKMRAMVEEKKQVTTLIQDNTQGKRKKWHGII
jgi:hypothetical protein